MSRDQVELEEFKKAALRCPLPPAVDVIGEKWAFLILRGAMNHLKHFEQFQEGLGIARNILSDRLKKLVDNGILERASDPRDKRKIVYSLTEKGDALLPVVVALRQWGEEWASDKPTVRLADERDGEPIRRIRVTAHDGRPLERRELMWVRKDTGETLTAARAIGGK